MEYMEQTTVGTAFKFLGPFLKLYSMYANNHQQASNTLQENLQKNEKFATFVAEQEERPEVNGLKLGALLITPVQRIPRYKLLLEDLLENTSPEHHDYLHLKEAAKQVGEIALHINEHVRQHENFQKMLLIQNSFDSSAPKILAPGREYLKEGKLNKISRRGGKSQERMFFLFSDLMLYGKPKLLDSGSSSYSCCCLLPLRHCSVERVLGTVQSADGGGMFRINCKDESLLLYCLDPEEAKVWVETIEAAIRKLNVNRQTLRKPSSNKVPVRGKSLMKMRIKEKKQDLKRKINGSKKKSSKGKTPSSPLKASLKEVSNCLTPPKRQRTDSDGSMSGASCSNDYERKNEINLDDWSPSAMNNDDDDDDLVDTISEEGSYEDSNEDEENIPAVVIENPPIPDTLDTNSYDIDLRNGLDPVACSSRGQGTNEGPDYSSQPWFNPKFQQEGEPVGHCSTWPIRKVIKSGSKVTSSIGEVMDSMRSSKKCSIM
ncbi:rho guanine nucleotide exchange factor 39-like isoform X2 [Mya arenaria]|nr:rho guanine nucleotide exchange factor 39-like isoform X2 [Mya arenaria]